MARPQKANSLASLCLCLTLLDEDPGSGIVGCLAYWYGFVMCWHPLLLVKENALDLFFLGEVLFSLRDSPFTVRCLIVHLHLGMWSVCSSVHICGQQLKEKSNCRPHSLSIIYPFVGAMLGKLISFLNMASLRTPLILAEGSSCTSSVSCTLITVYLTVHLL